MLAATLAFSPSFPASAAQNASGSAAQPVQEESVPQPFSGPRTQGAVVCCSGNTGLIVNIPVGWVNDDKVAKKLGLPAVLYPKGGNFNTAHAIIYPRVDGRNKGLDIEKAADLLIEETARRYRALPGGSGVKTSKGKDAVNAHGLRFAVRVIEDGPPANKSEYVAYVSTPAGVFIVVMSSTDPLRNIQYMHHFERILDEAELIDVAN